MTRRSRALFTLPAILLLGGFGCSSSEDEFAEMTPVAEVTYPDTVGITPAGEPLISFYAPLDAARPLVLREEKLTTYLVLPDCTIRPAGLLLAQVAYLDDDEPRLRLTLDGQMEEVPLGALPRGESYCLKNDFLALQVVRVSPTEISGAVFVRYPHSSVQVATPDPAGWIIDAVLLPPDEIQAAAPPQTEGMTTAVADQAYTTPDLGNLERFFLKLQGGVATGSSLTIQGQYAGDEAINTGQMFFSPAPQTPAEAAGVQDRTSGLIDELYLQAPGWRAAGHLRVEAVAWGDPYYCGLVNWTGRELVLRLSWSDPASGTVIFACQDTVGLVRWTDFLWYVDMDHIGREVLPVETNRLWEGCPPPAGVAAPDGTVLEQVEAPAAEPTDAAADQPTDEDK